MENTPDFPRLFPVQSGNDDSSAASDEPVGQTSHKLSPAEEWQMNVQAVRRFSRMGQWSEVLKLLQLLSTKHQNNESYKALGQRVWVALKSDIPAIDVVQALGSLLYTLGPRHEMGGHIAALAYLMADLRTPEHADRELAQGQAQQLLSLVCDAQGIQGQEAFARWASLHRLDDPDHTIAVVMQGLEGMVGAEWWIDRQALQRDMEQANAKKRQAADAHAPAL
ncbi:MAG: hypothetical protein HQL88_11055 [Magnetococcales bacterium]|nr:hypothetical protein [Magnetococcales bacterium]